jgi:hypothetical protein
MSEELAKIEERTRRIEQKIYNGMSHTLEKLEEKLPHLLTVEEHERIENERRRMSEEMGKRKDRILAGLGIALPFVTALLVWGLGQL